MLRLLFLAILLTGCSAQESPQLDRSTATANLTNPDATSKKILQIPEKSVNLGFIFVGVVGFFVLRRH